MRAASFVAGASHAAPGVGFFLPDLVTDTNSHKFAQEHTTFIIWIHSIKNLLDRCHTVAAVAVNLPDEVAMIEERVKRSGIQSSFLLGRREIV
jgi:hypothetical protein